VCWQKIAIPRSVVKQCNSSGNIQFIRILVLIFRLIHSVRWTNCHVAAGIAMSALRSPEPAVNPRLLGAGRLALYATEWRTLDVRFNEQQQLYWFWFRYDYGKPVGGSGGR
jgi:hypothetical protein